MSDRMIRKQVYLQRRHDLILKRLAGQRGISEAEVIRQALEREADLSAAAPKARKRALSSIVAYARSLRDRPELLGGEAYIFRREELYEKREQRPFKPAGS